MWGDKEKKLLEKICSHSGVLAKKVTNYKYLINFKGQKWYLWPRSGRYQFIWQNGDFSDRYYGGLKLFYHRYITETVKLPANFGKVWNQEEEEILCEMVEQFYSVRQIAAELERHPVNIVGKLAVFLDNDRLNTDLHDALFDVPIREIVD